MCSVVAHYMPIMFGFSTVSACGAMTSDYFIGFDNLEAVFRCPTVIDLYHSLLSFLWFLIVVMFW